MAFTTIDRDSLLRIELSVVIVEDKKECWLRIDTRDRKSHMATVKPEHIEEFADHMLNTVLEFEPGKKQD